MTDFEQDPLYRYSPLMRLPPDTDLIDNARKRVETYLGSADICENFNLHLDFVYKGMKIVCHADSTVYPQSEDSTEDEPQDFMTIDYMAEGDEAESALSVTLPFGSEVPVIIRDQIIDDEKIARNLGASAVGFLVALVDYTAQKTSPDSIDDETALEEGSRIIMDLLKNGSDALAWHADTLGQPPLAQGLPRTGKLISGLRTALAGAIIPQEYVTNQSPRATLLTDDGVRVTPSFQRRAQVSLIDTEVDDTFQIDLQKLHFVEDEGVKIPVDVRRSLSLPRNDHPEFTIVSTPRIPYSSSKVSKISDYLGGMSPFDKLGRRIARPIVAGDLGYFLATLENSRPAENDRS